VVLIGTGRAGGSGKTTICVNLAAIWGQDRKVLMIDLDEQGDSSRGYGVHDTGEALASALMGRTGLADAIHATRFGVDVAPAGEALSFVADAVQPDSVSRALAGVQHLNYDVVVIDCGPTLRPLVHAAWSAAPNIRAVVPVDSPKSLQAVARLRHAWEDAGLDLDAMRIALIRHDPRRVLDRELERQAREMYAESKWRGWDRVKPDQIRGTQAAFH
jgi:chromosome partitioning protein